jgi:ferredoxin-NADP reductase
MFTETQEHKTGRLRRVLDLAATPHGIDHYLDQVFPTFSSTEGRGRIESVRRQTVNTVTLNIRPNRQWRGFTAGQYTELSVEIDGVRHTRCYSISGAEGDRSVELTIKAQPEGLVSNFLVRHARPGMVVGLAPARGDFCLPNARPERLLLMSGGSGITPVLAMLSTLCAEQHRRPVTFVHYARSAADMTYCDELDALVAENDSVRLVRIFTEDPGCGDLDGFVDENQLDAIDPAWRSTETYLCGPAPLMAAIGDLFAAAGAGERLHTEAFTLTQVVSEAPTVSGTLKLRRSGVSVLTDGAPLLEQIERAGLAPKSGCRMGICHTCVCPLVGGTVRDLTTGQLTTGPTDTIRICVSAPVGDVDLDL